MFVLLSNIYLNDRIKIDRKSDNLKKGLIIIGMLIMLVVCSTTKVSKTDAILFKEEYESLNCEKTDYGNFSYRALDIDENNPFLYKEARDILKIGKNGIIVIEKEGTNDYNKLLDKLSNVLDDYVLLIMKEMKLILEKKNICS